MSSRRNVSPIEEYLDDLMVSLRREPTWRARRLMSEAEAHLYDVAAELARGGASDLDAEADAVRRFGSVDDIAGAEARAMSLSLPAAGARVGLTGLQLGSIGAIAVGVSGIVAAVIRALGGIGTLVDLNSGPSLSVVNCTRWLALDPTAHTCRAAALNDWALETIFYRIGLGALGVITLGVYFLVRPVARRHGIGLLPRSILDMAAAGMFGVAGLWTLGMGIDASLLHHGWGQWLSAAAVSLAAGLFYSFRLISRIREEGTAARGMRTT